MWMRLRIKRNRPQDTFGIEMIVLCAMEKLYISNEMGKGSSSSRGSSPALFVVYGCGNGLIEVVLYLS